MCGRCLFNFHGSRIHAIMDGGWRKGKVDMKLDTSPCRKLAVNSNQWWMSAKWLMLLLGLYVNGDWGRNRSTEAAVKCICYRCFWVFFASICAMEGTGWVVVATMFGGLKLPGSCMDLLSWIFRCSWIERVDRLTSQAPITRTLKMSREDNKG